jgi:hypothetical protein
MIYSYIKSDGTFSNSSAGQLALGCLWRADSQLTPRISQFKQLAFSGGGAREITYTPRRSWDYSGSAG